MSKFIPLVIVLMIFMCPARVLAASGSIRVLLPQDADEAVLHYVKIAECDEIGQKEVTEWLQEDVEYTEAVQTDGGGSVCVSDLEEGVYRLRLSGTPEYVFSESLISIPMWSEEEHCMLYDVTVSPKYTSITRTPETENDITPDTGDDNKGMVYLFFGVISFIIIAIISCHNRFKCGRM